MRRKRYQRGSLKPRKRNGKRYWYAQWRENHRPRSKELGLCSEVTRSEAEAKLAEILRPINAGIERRVVRDQSFASFVENVFLPAGRRKWKRSTDMTNEQQIACHLMPVLGQFSMRQITRQDLQELLDSKAATLSRSVLSHLRFHLRAIFEMAISEGVVDRNPATVLYTPRVAKPGRERPLLTGDMVRQLLSALELRERLLARLAVFEGMRPGEILGLQVADVQGNCLLLRRRVYKTDVDTPKNGRPRKIALSLGTRRLLGEWISTLPDRSPTAWVFPSETLETPLSLDNVWRRNMLPKLEAIGLGWATFQVMRRTNASLAHKAGIDPKVAADQRGHGLGVSMEVYTQSDLDQKLAAVRRLEQTLSPETEPRRGAKPLLQ